MTDEMLVEAVARAICVAENLADGYAMTETLQASIDDGMWRNFIVPAKAALAALPPEMRAAGEMKRALEGLLATKEIAAAGGSNKCGCATCVAADAARAALALASSPGQQSTKDGEEDGQADAASR